MKINLDAVFTIHSGKPITSIKISQKCIYKTASHVFLADICQSAFKHLFLTTLLKASLPPSLDPLASFGLWVSIRSAIP